MESLPEEKKPRYSQPKGSHLFVLVHGFQGTSNDLRIVKNYLSVQHPRSHFLCSINNERKTVGDINEMGKKLADEVLDYIKKFLPSFRYCGRISFISHSLGGVIARAALPYLEEYKDRMHTFLSFSSPHLGYLYSNSTIVNAGMWLIKKWFHSKCIEQLTLTDSAVLTDCFLYKLADASVKKFLNFNRGLIGLKMLLYFLLIKTHIPLMNPLEWNSAKVLLWILRNFI